MLSEQEEQAEKEASEVTSQFLGDYIVIFQEIESKLNQIIQLAVGENRFFLTNLLLSEHSNSSKIRIVKAIFNRLLSDTKDEFKANWLEEFNTTINKVSAEAAQRNLLIHGTYNYRFARAGGPVVCFYSKVSKDGLVDKSIALSEERRQQILSNISELAIKVGRIHLQAIHWAPDIFDDSAT